MNWCVLWNTANYNRFMQPMSLFVQLFEGLYFNVFSYQLLTNVVEYKRWILRYLLPTVQLCFRQAAMKLPYVGTDLLLRHMMDRVKTVLRQKVMYFVDFTTRKHNNFDSKTTQENVLENRYFCDFQNSLRFRPDIRLFHGNRPPLVNTGE